MDTYATKTRDLSCHLTRSDKAGVRGGYTSLAPGTSASLEQRNAKFCRTMGPQYLYARLITWLALSNGLGFWENPKESSKA